MLACVGIMCISQTVWTGTVMVYSDLINRFERRGSLVRKCVKELNCG